MSDFNNAYISVKINKNLILNYFCPAKVYRGITPEQKKWKSEIELGFSFMVHDLVYLTICLRELKLFSGNRLWDAQTDGCTDMDKT